MMGWPRPNVRFPRLKRNLKCSVRGNLKVAQFLADAGKNAKPNYHQGRRTRDGEICFAD